MCRSQGKSEQAWRKLVRGSKPQRHWIVFATTFHFLCGLVFMGFCVYISWEGGFEGHKNLHLFHCGIEFIVKVRRETPGGGGMWKGRVEQMGKAPSSLSRDCRWSMEPTQLPAELFRECCTSIRGVHIEFHRLENTLKPQSRKQYRTKSRAEK